MCWKNALEIIKLNVMYVSVCNYIYWSYVLICIQLVFAYPDK